MCVRGGEGRGVLGRMKGLNKNEKKKNLMDMDSSAVIVAGKEMCGGGRGYRTWVYGGYMVMGKNKIKRKKE